MNTTLLQHYYNNKTTYTTYTTLKQPLYNLFTTYIQLNNNTYTTIKQQIPPLRAYFFSQKRILNKYR